MNGLTLGSVARRLFSHAVPATPRLSKLLKLYSDLATSDPDTVSKNVRVFARFIAETGDVRCHEVTRLMVTQYLASLRDSGKADATIRSYGLCLSSVCGWGVSNIDGFAVNPCKGVKLPKLEKREPQIWTTEDMERLDAAIDEMPWRDPVRRLQWHGMLQVAYGCGMRIGEVLNLRWQDIDLDPRCGHPTVHIRHRDCKLGQWWAWKTKGRKDRPNVLPQPAVDVLRRMQVHCTWMFPFLPQQRCLYLQANADTIGDRTRKTPYTGLYDFWAQVKKQAGVKGDGAFHNMRRGRAKAMAKHLTERELRAHFGWESPATADLYTGYVDSAEAVADAYEAIDAGGEGRTPTGSSPTGF